MAVAERLHDQAQYGGYAYEFFKVVPEKYMCSTICTKVLRDPHLTACCGQHFCESCLHHWFLRQGREVCPHCREENFNHFLDKPVKREINQLAIRCTNYGVGCVWVGELITLKSHLESEKGCGYVEVDCTNKCKERPKRKDVAKHLTRYCPLRKGSCPYCGETGTYQAITERHFGRCPNYPLDCPNNCSASKIKRAEMDQHRRRCPLESVICPNMCEKQLKRKELVIHFTNYCPLRKYKCRYCGKEDTYQTITEKHYDECPSYPLDCPKMCGARGIKRAKMGQHRSKCPLEPVECPFQEAGCQVKLVRGDLGSHIANDSQQHLLLVMSAFQELKKETNADFHIMKKGVSRVVDHLLQSCTPPQVAALQSIQALVSYRLRNVGDKITFTIPNVVEYFSHGKVWSSPPFYYKEGYKMKLDVSFCETEKSSHATSKFIQSSCSLYLLKGELDDELDWPISHANAVELIIFNLFSATPSVYVSIDSKQNINPVQKEYEAIMIGFVKVATYFCKPENLQVSLTLKR